jgi:hypothetical protein
MTLATLAGPGTFPAHAAEAVQIGPAHRSLLPGGKEVDAIYGDYLLRSDKITLTVGGTPSFREANVNTQGAQGAALDLVRRDLPGGDNDLLVAFYPHGHFLDDPAATRAQIVKAGGPEVLVRFHRPARSGLQGDAVEATTEYILRDGEPFVRIRTTYKNPSPRPAGAVIYDKIRADGLFRIPPAGLTPSLLYYEPWHRAAYGVVRAGGAPIRSYANPAGKTYGQEGGNRLDFPDLLSKAPDEKPPSGAFPPPSPIPANGSVAIERCLVPGRHPADVQFVLAEILKQKTVALPMRVVDPDGGAVAKADVVARRGDAVVSEGWTDAAGKVSLCLPDGGDYRLIVTQAGRAPVERSVSVHAAAPVETPVTIGEPALVSFDVYDVTRGRNRGPVKVVFRGIEGTKDPDFGPAALAYQAQNLCFSPDGRFTVPVPPGRYELLIGRGAEYTLETKQVTVRYGETAAVTAEIRRAVGSPNWIMSDLHNHTTASNDSIADTRGRVVGIAASGIEFAPATEHNRITSFAPFIEKENLTAFLKSAGSIELSGRPGPGATNHQNAFPLRIQEGRQSGGAPRTHRDPSVQIRRLYEHDNSAEKFVQHNHPDVAWVYFDKDRDGKIDEGLGTRKYTHGIEINRLLVNILPETAPTNKKAQRSRIFHWLQMLNQDDRIFAVANSDAHATSFNNGSVFTYIHTDTDSPAAVDERKMARAAKKGNMVLSNGPFLEVLLNGALPGEDIRLIGEGKLKVKVQCAPWMEIDRVQVLVNGRQDPSLGFTRTSHPQWFTSGPGAVRFDREIPLRLPGDAHIIVVATGEGSKIGPFHGGYAGQPPTALSNPIFVDVDGGGFRANRDTLGLPLPTKGRGGNTEPAEEASGPPAKGRFTATRLISGLGSDHDDGRRPRITAAVQCSTARICH